MSDSSDWLDTQTKAQLAESPPDKLAPPVVAGFSLVLLERGPDRRRVDQTLQALVANPACAPSACPCVVQRGLAFTDALQGQFELICADSISVFVNDDVLRTANASYLQELFQTLRKSPEFQPVTVCVHSVPIDDGGMRFLHQFFGELPRLPATHVVARKKARIMQHWGSKLGAVIESEDESTSSRGG
jgi:hypothetical protein